MVLVRCRDREWRILVEWSDGCHGPVQKTARATTVIASVRGRNGRAAPRVIRVWRRASFTERAFW